MSDLRLNIQTLSSNVTTRNKPDEIQIRGNQADLVLHKKDSKFSIRQKLDTVEIGNYPARRQFDNSKNVMDMTKKTSRYAESKAMKAIAQYSSDGDRMMDIERKGSKPIAEIAKRKSQTFSKVNLDLVYYPNNSIDIKVRKGYIKYDFQPGEIKTNVNKNLQIDVKKGNLNVNVDRYPKVLINVVGGNTDQIV